MGGDDLHLGDFELLVLLAVLRTGEEAYAVPVGREIEGRTGRTASRGALYVTLERLVGKGLLESRLGEGGDERRGRPRRYYAATPRGLEAVRVTRAAMTAMWGGLETLLEGGEG